MDEKFRGVRVVLGHSVALLVFVGVDGMDFSRGHANCYHCTDRQEPTMNAPIMRKSVACTIAEMREVKRCGALVCFGY